MKIAFFTDSYYPQLNGIALSVKYFADNLRKQDITVYVFAPKVKGHLSQEEDLYYIPSVRAFPTVPDSVRIPLPIPHKSFLQIKNLDFDLVHAHGNGAFSLLGLAVARSKKVPYILTFHTQLAKFAHYFLGGKIFKESFINKSVLKRFGNASNGLTTPSQKMKDELIASGITKHIEMIPNFVDLDKFKPLKSDYLHKKCNIPLKSPILLSVGRLGKEKNFRFLIEMFEKVVKENNETHLVIAGPDWGEYKHLKKLVNKLKLDGSVHLPGPIANDDMNKAYCSADLFVFASTSEVHPMVAIEAAASGLPLIVADDKAFDDVVVNGANGFSLPLDQETFAQKIVELLKNKTLIEKLSKDSPKIVKKACDSKSLTKKLLTYYHQVIKDYRASHSPV